MDVSTAVRAALAVLQRPADILPAYLLTPAVGAAARVVPMAGLAVALLYLGTTGRLARSLELLADRELDPPPPDAEPGAFEAWTRQLAPVLEPLATPAVAVIAVVTLVGTAVAFVVLSAAVTAAQLSACRARLRRRQGMVAAVRGGPGHALQMLLVRLLELAVWVLTLLVALLVLGVAAAVDPLVAAFGAVVVVPGAVTVLLAARALFAFVPVAVVVDEAGASDAVRGAAGFLAANPAGAVAYYGLSIAGLAALAGVTLVLATTGGVPLAGVLGFAVLSPFLDLVKTGLYGDHRDALPPEPKARSELDDRPKSEHRPEPEDRPALRGRPERPAPPESPATPDGSLTSRVAAGLRRGCGDAAAFVRGSPVLHLVALAFGLAGFAAGWLLVGPLADAVSTSIGARLEGHRPVGAAVGFAANNWAVAVSVAFGGLALAVPAVATLAFNGIVFGIYARTEETPLELLAFVLPHGALEVPAIVVAGALGIHLGFVGWRAIAGRADAEVVADELRHAFWIAVGLAILLAVAGVIEGFVSPYYYRAFI